MGTLTICMTIVLKFQQTTYTKSQSLCRDVYEKLVIERGCLNIIWTFPGGHWSRANIQCGHRKILPTSYNSVYSKDMYMNLSKWIWYLTLFDMGGAIMAPQNVFWPLCPNALEEEAETWWLLRLAYGTSKKVIFSCLGYPVLPWKRVCQGVLEICWSYRSICFLITIF